MSNLVDKNALIDAMMKKAERNMQNMGATVLHEVVTKIISGEFDAKPEPSIRTLPLCPGSVNVRSYNMCDPESRFAYLIDITDELLSYRNTHLEKDHANNNERIAWLMDQVKYLLERGGSPPQISIHRDVTSCLTTKCRFNIKTNCNLRAVRVDDETRKCLCFEER